MEELNKLCEELNIEANTLNELDEIEKEQLYNLFKDVKFIEQGKETFGNIEKFFNRLITQHILFDTKPLKQTKEQIINEL